MNTSTAETRWKRRQARIQFLRDNPALLYTQSIQEQTICRALKAAGLLSKSTYWRDAGIKHLIEEAKYQDRHQSKQDK